MMRYLAIGDIHGCYQALTTLADAVCIDTWAHHSGWLTCLDVGCGKYWQSNQHGESRSAWLEETK